MHSSHTLQFADSTPIILQASISFLIYFYDKISAHVCAVSKKAKSIQE
jgi:hypothetical protein